MKVTVTWHIACPVVAGSSSLSESLAHYALLELQLIVLWFNDSLSQQLLKHILLSFNSFFHRLPKILLKTLLLFMLSEGNMWLVLRLTFGLTLMSRFFLFFFGILRLLLTIFIFRFFIIVWLFFSLLFLLFWLMRLWLGLRRRWFIIPFKTVEFQLRAFIT